MNFAAIYAQEEINRLIEDVPGFLDRLKGIWDSMVEWWMNHVVFIFSDSYWAIAHAEQTLIAALIVLAVIVAVGVIIIMQRRGSAPRYSSKPQTSRDAVKEAKRAAKAKNWVRAGELFEQAEKYGKAVEMYMRGNAFTRAAQVYFKKLNQPDKALEILLRYNLWDHAGQLLVSMGRTGEAARHFMKAGKELIAAETFEKAGELAQAADLYRNQKRYAEAARCYAGAKSWGPAGEMHVIIYKQFRQTIQGREGPRDIEKLQDLAKKAAFFLKQSGSLKSAAEILLDSRQNAMAAEMFALAGELVRAAELFLEANEFKRAAELFHKSGDTRKAAEIMAQWHQSEGRSVEAAKYQEKAENFLDAADIWAGQQRFDRAAELYLKGGDSRTAAEMFVAAGMPERAVAIYEKIGDMEAALRLIEDSGDQSAMAELYERTGRYYEAAIQYHERGLLDKAMALFEKIGPDHSSFADALYRQGRIFIDKGEFEKALEKLQLMAGRIPLSPTTLDYFYLLATVYERLDHLPYAANIYQQIIAINYNYKDVVMRINAVTKKYQEQHGANAATVQGGGWAEKGRSIGYRYKIVSELGRGGMGVVYLAEDSHLGRQVAFKVLAEELKANQQMVQNFLREARSLAKLSHPYIVSIFDAGEENGLYYIIMEYVEGKDFKQLMGKNRRLPLAAGTQVFSQLCQALDYAHNLNIIHRDIKPANIMWTSTNIIKVMDFGLAKMMDEMREGRTVVAGTPYYMSPEQTLGKNVDNRADIYSMGVTMYELLTGQVPFKEGDIGYHHLHTPPRPPSELNPQITRELEKIILKCLAKDAGQRYQSARDINEELLLIMQRRSQ